MVAIIDMKVCLYLRARNTVKKPCLPYVYMFSLAHSETVSSLCVYMQRPLSVDLQVW